MAVTTAWLAALNTVSTPSACAVESSQPDLAVFKDAKNLFRLEYPDGWQVVNKAGATLLLRDPTQKYSQIGVTVTPVKIASLLEFGSVHDIGEKLLKAEASKESTVPGGVTLVSENNRIGAASGATFYDYEYRLVTTHGNKRVFNSVAVESSTLFIMNAQVFEKGDTEEANEAEIKKINAVSTALRRAMSVFDVGRDAVRNA
jgi:predicted Zn-dependent protease